MSNSLRAQQRRSARSRWSKYQRRNHSNNQPTNFKSLNENPLAAAAALIGGLLSHGRR